MFFEKHITGKNIAFIGLSPIISNKQLGDEINTFDVVIRTHILIPVLHKDYGIKTDIIFLNKISFQKNDNKISEIKNLKGIITKDTNYVNFDIDTYYISHDDKMSVNSRIHKITGKDSWDATSGIITVYLCLKHRCKNFKFFGITGYQDKKGNIINPVDKDCSNHYIKNLDNYNFFNENKRVHNFYVQNDYIRHLLKEGEIDMDKYSREYFKPRVK